MQNVQVWPTHCARKSGRFESADTVVFKYLFVYYVCDRFLSMCLLSVPISLRVSMKITSYLSSSISTVYMKVHRVYFEAEYGACCLAVLSCVLYLWTCCVIICLFCFSNFSKGCLLTNSFFRLGGKICLGC